MQASVVPGCDGQAAPNWRKTGESLSFYILLLGLRRWHSSHSSLPGLSLFLFIRSCHQPFSLSSEARTCRAANCMWWVFLTNNWSHGYKALASRPAFLTSPAAGAPIPLLLVSGRVLRIKGLLWRGWGGSQAHGRRVSLLYLLLGPLRGCTGPLHWGGVCFTQPTFQSEAYPETPPDPQDNLSPNLWALRLSQAEAQHSEHTTSLGWSFQPLVTRFCCSLLARGHRYRAYLRRSGQAGLCRGDNDPDSSARQESSVPATTRHG